MSRTNCIQHRPKTPLVILHQDYLDICDNNTPAAILLKILEYWTDVKFASQKQVEVENKIRGKESLSPIDYDLWIYKTHQEFMEDSLGLLKEYQVRDGLKVLLDKRYISKRNNPKYQWDRTLQYRVNISIVQNALNNDSIRDISPMEDEPVTHQFDTGNGALPEITTQISTERVTPPDFLDNVLNQQGAVNESTAPNPQEQWFEYSDKALKIFQQKLARYLNEDEKTQISTLASEANFSLDRWEQSLTECNLNYSGHRVPISRVIEVYQAGGTWAGWQKWMAKQNGGEQKSEREREKILNPVTGEWEGGYYN